MTNEQQQTAERIARIETNLERLAESQDRLITVVERVTNSLELRVRTLEHNEQRVHGVLKLIGWLGAPATAGIVLFLAQRG